jgi:hypothetical protein
MNTYEAFRSLLVVVNDVLTQQFDVPHVPSRYVEYIALDGDVWYRGGFRGRVEYFGRQLKDPDVQTQVVEPRFDICHIVHTYDKMGSKTGDFYAHRLAIQTTTE